MTKKPLKQLVENYIEGYELSEITSYVKRKISIDQNSYIETDVFLQSKTEENSDFVIEVKNYDSDIPKSKIEKFINEKKVLETILKPNTGYIFCSVNQLKDEFEELLKQNNIMIMYGKD